MIFSPNGEGESTASYVSEGSAIVQLRRKARGIVSVAGNLEGMPPVIMGVYDNPWGADALLRVEAPAGMTVTITSATEVDEAKLMPV